MFRPKKPYELWNINPTDFPSSKGVGEQIKFLLNYAILAPSTLNTQPWYFSLDKNKINVYADLDKKLTLSDPKGRQLYISLGCCLFNLLVAADYFNFNTKVTYFPFMKSNVTASIQLTKNLNPQKSPLKKYFSSITRRHSNRSIFVDKKLPIQM